MGCRGLGILPLLAFTAVAQHLTSPAFEAQFTARELDWRDDVLPIIMRQQATEVDFEARQFVSALGVRLSYAITQPVGLQCRFILYDDALGLRVPGFGLLRPTHDVQTLPGGIILVPVSLFAVTADEAEFSSALARGIAHTALQHWMRTIVLFQWSLPWKPSSKSLLFSRSFENEADYAAVSILSRSGLNPDAVARFAKNARASFDTSESRSRFIQKAIAEMPQRTYGPDRSLQFEALKSRLAEKPETI